MSHSLTRVLDVLSVAALIIAVLIFMTGGLAIEVGSVSFRARGIANPVAAALIAAGLRRLLSGDDDPLSRLRRDVSNWLGISPGNRILGWLYRHGDALALAVLAVVIFDRGVSGIIAVEGDGVGYYAYLRSTLIDHDLDFLNEYRDFDPRQQWVARMTPIGRVENPFAIGPAVLWTPFFLFGWLAAKVSRWAGAEVALDGYSAPFIWSCAGGTWLFGILAVVLTYRLLLHYYERRVALLAAIGTTLASPMAYYATYANFYSHAHSFLVATLFFLLCIRTTIRDGLGRWLALGLVAGLVAITRWQDAVFWIVPAITLASGLPSLGKETGLLQAVARAVARGLTFLAGIAVAITPQLFVFKRLNGYWLGIPQGDGFVEPIPRWLWETLFSSFRGLYWWSPLLFVGTIGLVVAVWQRRPWAAAFLVAFLLQLYANASVSQWWAGHAFGARRFSSCVALFALGLGEMLHRARSRPRVFNALVALIAAAVLWNHLLLQQWLGHEMPHGTPVDVEVILAHAWDDLTGLELRSLVGQETVMALLLQRLSDLMGSRFPLLLFSVVFLQSCRWRASSSPPS